MKKSLETHCKYPAVVQAIANDIRNGVLAADTDFPAREELCRRYSLSPVTVHKVQQELERQGLIVARPGKRFLISGSGIPSQTHAAVKLNRLMLFGSMSRDVDFEAIRSGFLQGCREYGLEGASEIITGVGDVIQSERSFSPDTGLVVLLNKPVLAELAVPLLEQELPLVTINSFFPGRSAVLTDNRHGVNLLLDYARHNGAHRVLMAGGFFPDASAWEDGERQEAFCDLLKQYEFSGELDLTGDPALLREHIRRFNPDVLMFTRDSAAVHFLYTAGAFPLLITGFGGLREIPHLTTICVNFHELGRCAVGQLVQSCQFHRNPTVSRVPGYLSRQN